MPKWIYGRQTVSELLNSEYRVIKILLSKEAEKSSLTNILSIVKQKNVPCEFVPKKFIDSIIKGNHQGIAAQIESIEPRDFKSFLETIDSGKTTFLVLLDEIQDPQNLGAIIRSAVCFGCSGIVIPKWRSASLNETVMRSSSGASAHIPIVQISNLSVAIERLKEKGFFIYGADVSGQQSLDQAQLEFPLALVLGNEHRGIKPIIKKLCDNLIYIPQHQKVASLNVSSAGTIFFYEIAKRLKGLK